MTAFEAEEILKGAVEDYCGGATVFAGAVTGEPEWPRVLVKVSGTDLKSEAPWRGRHSATVSLQSQFDADGEGASAYTDHAALATQIWQRLEQREELLDDMGDDVMDVRLETYRADVDARQGLFISNFGVEIETN